MVQYKFKIINLILFKAQFKFKFINLNLFMDLFKFNFSQKFGFYQHYFSLLFHFSLKCYFIK